MECNIKKRLTTRAILYHWILLETVFFLFFKPKKTRVWNESVALKNTSWQCTLSRLMQRSLGGVAGQRGLIARPLGVLLAAFLRAAHRSLTPGMWRRALDKWTWVHEAWPVEAQLRTRLQHRAISLVYYLRIENAEGNVLIAVYLYACVLFA